MLPFRKEAIGFAHQGRRLERLTGDESETPPYGYGEISPHLYGVHGSLSFLGGWWKYA